MSRRNGMALRLIAASLLFTARALAQTPTVLSDQVPTAEGLTLEETYALAAQRNPRIAAAAAVADASAARVSASGLPPDPVFQIGAMNLSLPDLDADMPSSMAPSIQLMQMVPFPGKLGLSERIAGKTSEMARSDAGETAWMIRADVAMAFYELYAADRQIEVMRRTLRLLEDFERVARAMYGAGTGRQSDVLRANVEIARMEADIARMEAMRKVAAARLNGLLDRPAETPVPSPVLPAVPAAVPARDTLRSWAEETRPMLEKAKTGVERADAGVDLAKKELWPDLALGLQYGQRDLGMGTERMGGAMIGFSIPIFAAGRQLKMRDEATAMRQMAKADLAGMRASVDAEIGELLAELERARTLLDLYETAVIPQAESNVESSFSSYRVGSVDFMTLVDAQMTLNRYEQEHYALLGAYGTAISRLETAVGRELPPTPEMLAEVR
ncbi:MAG TPA: TolC family protein [Gemmatimonadota bacterium]|nr:TolC family protein [Gemmatimonadota bacterium]